MSTTASPKPPRVKQQPSKSAAPASPAHNGKQAQRRQKPNRAHSSPRTILQRPNNEPGVAVTAQNQALADSAVFPSEELQRPSGPRGGRKHTHSQPSADRLFSPTMAPSAAVTDFEVAPPNPSPTPAKAQGAYAGPTFHASPAPSALPIPKFLSRSMPAKSVPGPPTPPMDDSSDSVSSPAASPLSPSRAPVAIPPRQEDSPLDMLFKADKAEKARNANRSPLSATFSSPPTQPPAHDGMHHSKQDSYSSLNAVFPIELDSETNNPRPSPSAASPFGHRSVTAPSRIPQVDDTIRSNQVDVVQDLLNRVALSQKKPAAPTPPKPVHHLPSEPSPRHQTPSPLHNSTSPFHSTSNPTTPVPATQESSVFFYGNRNLSPLFKAAKSDSTKPISGLRTEITADSPLLPQGGGFAFAQGGFSSAHGPTRADPHMSPNRTDATQGGPVDRRRGSAPYVQPYRELPNSRKVKTPGRQSHHTRPESYPHANVNGAANGGHIPLPKPSTKNPFIPSSVQAKQHSLPTKSSDTTSLEQDLKRLLNVKMSGNTTGAL
ncbi:hypothetical protein BDV95DRAFT_500561 [Massariosphaeria phaeospora]|uniref:Proteophosphoglycan 5 n=1 Tax=Massariosphaeria phaeospora TaxID=100035 RepID=A0A7C8M2U6_9PLEO|nr:hypothetical protein BDV95DRAFT_500561 [Massariosphaeria phaeospora]